MGGGLAAIGALAAGLLISKRYGAAAEMPAEEPAHRPLIQPRALPEPA